MIERAYTLYMCVHCIYAAYTVVHTVVHKGQLLDNAHRLLYKGGLLIIQILGTNDQYKSDHLIQVTIKSGSTVLYTKVS